MGLLRWCIGRRCHKLKCRFVPGFQLEFLSHSGESNLRMRMAFVPARSLIDNGLRTVNDLRLVRESQLHKIKRVSLPRLVLSLLILGTRHTSK